MKAAAEYWIGFAIDALIGILFVAMLFVFASLTPDQASAQCEIERISMANH